MNGSEYLLLLTGDKEYGETALPSSSGRARLALTEYYDMEHKRGVKRSAKRTRHTTYSSLNDISRAWNPPTLKRLLLTGVEVCRRLSSDWGSWTLSIPAPSSSFFSSAEYASPSATQERTDKGGKWITWSSNSKKRAVPLNSMPFIFHNKVWKCEARS